MRLRIAALLKSGAVDLVAATGLAGAAGYVLTLLAGIELGPTRYVAFGVLWASLFFAVGTLNGLQQEVARATREAPARSSEHVVRHVTAIVAGGVFLVTVIASPAWVPLVFAGGSWWLGVPLALGLAGHTVATSLVGMLHGLHKTRLIAAAVVIDALLRFAIVVALLSTTRELGPISWALVVPYAITPLLIWVVARRSFEHAAVDVNERVLLRHAATTLLAAASSGAMISGISLLIAAAGRDVSPAHVGAIIFAVNITRAPLIIVVGALQNLIVVRLRDRADWRLILLQILAAVASVAALLAVLAAFAGGPVIAYLLHGQTLSPVVLAVIVGSGGLVALMSVTGAAIIARGRHSANTAGWIVAALSTAIILFAVPGFDVALPSGLLLGPVAGLLTHAAAIAIDRHPPIDSSSDPRGPAI